MRYTNGLLAVSKGCRCFEMYIYRCIKKHLHAADSTKAKPLPLTTQFEIHINIYEQDIHDVDDVHDVLAVV